MISKNFIKSSLIYTVGGALPMASAIILLPFYMSLLSTSVYGVLSLYLAFSLFVQVLVTYSFDSSLYIHYHELKGDLPRLSAFISSAFIFMMFIAIGAGSILVLLGDWAFSLIFNDQKISFFPFGLMSIAIGVFQSLFKVYSNLIQTREMPEIFLWSNLMLFSLIVVFTIAGLYIFPETLIGPIGGRVLAGFLLSLWIAFKVIKEFGLHFEFQLLKATFGFNNYLFIYQIQLWVINYIDRFLMVFFLPVSEIGIYDFSIKCLLVIEYVMTGLNSSFFPKVVSTIIAQETKKSTTELNRYYHGLTAIVMFMISLEILILPWLVELAKEEQGYEEAIKYFPYLAVLYILKSMRLYFASPYAVLKVTKPLPFFYLIISLIKIIGLLFLIDSLGVLGTVISSMVASLIEIFLLKFGITKKFSFQFNAFKLLVAPLILLVAVLILEPTVAQYFAWQIHGFYVLLVLALMFWAYRNELKGLKASDLINIR